MEQRKVANRAPKFKTLNCLNYKTLPIICLAISFFFFLTSAEFHTHHKGEDTHSHSTHTGLKLIGKKEKKKRISGNEVKKTHTPNQPTFVLFHLLLHHVTIYLDNNQPQEYIENLIEIECILLRLSLLSGDGLLCAPRDVVVGEFALLDGRGGAGRSVRVGLNLLHRHFLDLLDLLVTDDIRLVIGHFQSTGQQKKPTRDLPTTN